MAPHEILDLDFADFIFDLRTLDAGLRRETRK